MAHFIIAGFTFQSTPETTGLNELKLSRPPEILSLHDMIEGGSALCWGDGGKTPEKVSVWRENHVKATDGSLRGLCKEGKKADD